MSAHHRIEGLDDIKRRMRAAQADIGDKAVKAGLRGAGRVVKAAIVAAAPRDDETPDGVHINENVQVARSRRNSGPGVEVFTVGIRYGKRVDSKGRKRATEGAAWYWRLIEFGTARIRKSPFIRPAFEASVGAALKTFTASMSRYVKRWESRQ